LRQLVVQLLLERQQPIKVEVTHKGDITQRHKLPALLFGYRSITPGTIIITRAGKNEKAWAAVCQK
jgi:hypothetical protein